MKKSLSKTTYKEISKKFPDDTEEQKRLTLYIANCKDADYSLMCIGASCLLKEWGWDKVEKRERQKLFNKHKSATQIDTAIQKLKIRLHKMAKDWEEFTVDKNE